ncbi:SsgA family sporulation/cell division regulator [Streptomyces sp. Act143]|uniref:SsgA family sporulation/cell division regulator n=1 Tax=Streptomyces sp. Act143 TaxID=2200760 RepID=UPI000D6768C5|nr:SsgA family sporulation/cell division regulator [Streptomyces sp. Act143]PWI19399.1 SsgA family sporulation/cell division regulator [Streptomyces sp. Act143]
MNGDQSGLRIRETAPEGPAPLHLRLGRVLSDETTHPMRAEFRFDPGAPMICSVTFKPGPGMSVTWRIGRELLYRGLFEDSGEWDVQVWPAVDDEQGLAWLMLDSKGRNALFRLPIAPLAAWLEATYQAVPAEEEGQSLDWDSFIEELLDTPGPPAQ